MEVFDRFYSKVNKTDTCWNWTASLNHGGYGQFMFEGVPRRAHRWIYEHTVGKIPEGMVIDHLCRNRKCVRVDHLEVVTRAENNKRGLAGIENNAQSKKTHCPNGHEYSGKNKYGKRICRICANEQARNYYLRKKGKLL
jgi:hypothetical protein